MSSDLSEQDIDELLEYHKRYVRQVDQMVSLIRSTKMMLMAYEEEHKEAVKTLSEIQVLLSEVAYEKRV